MNKEDLILNTVKEIVSFMKITCEIQVVPVDEKVYNVDIIGNDLSFLIGHRGQTMDSLQNVVSLIVLKKTGEFVTTVVDINQYKKQRVEKIQGLVKRLIDRVRFFQEEVPMPAMNPWERRQVHTFVSEYDDIASESLGMGTDRHVVLKPKKV
jgi:spoIIIJ-associated protein